MNSILLNPSKLSQPQFNEIVGAPLQVGIQQTEVLVIGAGGLGCEILKALSLSFISTIHLIDLDTVDVTNLNRQFLFRQNDVGKFKADVAAEFIMKRVPKCKVIPYTKKIQEFPPSFYQQFPVIIAGLDNVQARQWINKVVVNMVQKDEQGNIIPETRHYLIDGGTEGLNGQARVIAPFETACYECTIDQLPKQIQYQMCTIATTPRIPEHCIAYAYEVLWPKDKKLDKDNYEHMNWIYEQALNRAQQFNISGVTYKLTMGVVKNIIPAIASTNALIAAHCVNECIKILTGNGSILQNYFQWVGQAEGSGINTTIINQEKNENCYVCADVKEINLTVDISDKLSTLIDKLPLNSQLETTDHKILITPLNHLKEHYEHLLSLTFAELVKQGIIKQGQKLVCLDNAKTIEIRLCFIQQQQQQQQQQ